MVQYDPLQYLPTAEELPDSDDTPVDNELQVLIPSLLRAILSWLWRERQDWFLGVNMGVYYHPQEAAIVPDGFLSLGVVRRKSDRGRLSYVLWQEDNIVPQWVLEVVSQTPGGEYGEKLQKYARLGVLYYTIYNPNHWKRDKHEPFEVYRLENGQYVRQPGEPVWMPELELAVGRGQGVYEGWEREWLYWYDRQGNRFPSPEEIARQERQRAEQERQRAEQERQQAERLANYLRARGIDPDTIS
jgi:Uma2 family endonuclease